VSDTPPQQSRERWSALYFGCWAGLGHHFHLPGGRDAGSYREVQEWLGFGGIDGKLNPSERQGECALHHRNGWTALAFADRTVDTRGGSNSVFFFRGTLTFEEAVAAAGEHFPHIVARQPVPLWNTAEGRAA
jgi:hypothetical protein